MTLNEFLSKAGDLFKSNTADSALTEKLSAVQTEVTQLKDSIATLSTQNGELSQKLELATKEATDAKAALEKANTDHAAALAEKEADVEKRASAKAIEFAAAQGIKPVKADEAKGGEPKTFTEKCLAAKGK